MITFSPPGGEPFLAPPAFPRGGAVAGPLEGTSAESSAFESMVSGVLAASECPVTPSAPSMLCAQAGEGRAFGGVVEESIERASLPMISGRVTGGFSANPTPSQQPGVVESLWRATPTDFKPTAPSKDRVMGFAEEALSPPSGDGEGSAGSESDSGLAGGASASEPGSRVVSPASIPLPGVSPWVAGRARNREPAPVAGSCPDPGLDRGLDPEASSAVSNPAPVPWGSGSPSVTRTDSVVSLPKPPSMKGESWFAAGQAPDFDAGDQGHSIDATQRDSATDPAPGGTPREPIESRPGIGQVAESENAPGVQPSEASASRRTQWVHRRQAETGGRGAAAGPVLGHRKALVTGLMGDRVSVASGDVEALANSEPDSEANSESDSELAGRASASELVFGAVSPASNPLPGMPPWVHGPDSNPGSVPVSVRGSGSGSGPSPSLEAAGPSAGSNLPQGLRSAGLPSSPRTASWESLPNPIAMTGESWSVSGQDPDRRAAGNRADSDAVSQPDSGAGSGSSGGSGDRLESRLGTGRMADAGIAPGIQPLEARLPGRGPWAHRRQTEAKTEAKTGNPIEGPVAGRGLSGDMADPSGFSEVAGVDSSRFARVEVRTGAADHGPRSEFSVRVPESDRRVPGWGTESGLMPAPDATGLSGAEKTAQPVPGTGIASAEIASVESVPSSEAEPAKEGALLQPISETEPKKPSKMAYSSRFIPRDRVGNPEEGTLLNRAGMTFATRAHDMAYVPIIPVAPEAAPRPRGSAFMESVTASSTASSGIPVIDLNPGVSMLAANAGDPGRMPQIDQAAETTERVVLPRNSSVARLSDQLNGEVVLLQRMRTASMTAVLRPDAGSELRVDLRRREGRIEIRATLERGEAQAIAEGWPELQRQLQVQGVQLLPLERQPSATASGSLAEAAGERSPQSGGRGRNPSGSEEAAAGTRAEAGPQQPSPDSNRSVSVPVRQSASSRMLESWA